MKILMRIQYGRDDYDEVLVDEFDYETIKKIKLHNKLINHKVYEEKKIESLYTVEKFQVKIGHEIEDFESDPFYAFIEEWYENKDKCFELCLALLDEAILTLSLTQQKVIQEIKKSKEKINYSKIGQAVGVSDVGAKKIHLAALHKLRLFFRQYSELEEYFPNLFKD